MQKCNVACLLLWRSEEWNFINEAEKVRLQHKIAEDGEFWWEYQSKKKCSSGCATTAKMIHTTLLKCVKTITVICFPSYFQITPALQSPSPTRVYWVLPAESLQLSHTSQALYPSCAPSSHFGVPHFGAVPVLIDQQVKHIRKSQSSHVKLAVVGAVMWVTLYHLSRSNISFS